MTFLSSARVDTHLGPEGRGCQGSDSHAASSISAEVEIVRWPGERLEPWVQGRSGAGGVVLGDRWARWRPGGASNPSLPDNMPSATTRAAIALSSNRRTRPGPVLGPCHQGQVGADGNVVLTGDRTLEARGPLRRLRRLDRRSA